MTDPAPERSHELLLALLEAALYLSPEPVSLPHLAYPLGESRERIAAALASLAAEYALSHLRDVVENLPPPAPLSQAALETAPIIAYKQPITAGELEAIRGVRNRDTLRALLKRKIIAPAGGGPHGHAMRYRTTRRFLAEFGLESLHDLPSLEELQQRRAPFDLEQS